MRPRRSRTHRGRSARVAPRDRSFDLGPVAGRIREVEENLHDRLSAARPRKAQLVTHAGLEGVAADDCPGCPYELIASGAYAGSLIHSPNIYDFPASLHISRILGGESLWVHNGQPVNFAELWMDERAKMLRLPGIVATSPDRRVLETLCAVAKDWNPVRYA